jgi:hypothetical protein
LQRGFSDGQDALALELLTFAEAELFDYIP